MENKELWKGRLLRGQAPLSSISSDPGLLLSPGVTFSFFWKTQEQSRPSPSAYGGQVISSGFKVCSSGGKGLVELYMRENSMTWEASFNPPGKAACGPSGPLWGCWGPVSLLGQVGPRECAKGQRLCLTTPAPSAVGPEARSRRQGGRGL